MNRSLTESKALLEGTLKLYRANLGLFESEEEEAAHYAYAHAHQQAGKSKDKALALSRAADEHENPALGHHLAVTALEKARDWQLHVARKAQAANYPAQVHGHAFEADRLNDLIEKHKAAKEAA